MINHREGKHTTEGGFQRRGKILNNLINQY